MCFSIAKRNKLLIFVSHKEKQTKKAVMNTKKQITSNVEEIISNIQFEILTYEWKGDFNMMDRHKDEMKRKSKLFMEVLGISNDELISFAAKGEAQFLRYTS